MSDYYDTDKKRAVRHSNILLECIANSKKKQQEHEHTRQSNINNSTSNTDINSQYKKKR